MIEDVVIAGAAEVPQVRHPGPEVTTRSVLADALLRALEAADLDHGEVDGLGVAAFGLGPDHAIDLAWHLGLTDIRWVMEDVGGACLNMLSHAVRAIQAGDAEVIVLMAGDTRFAGERYVDLVDNYNVATQDHLRPLPACGPPTMFSFVTQRHMAKHGLTREHYGHVVAMQRAWAGTNPLACYREPLSIDEYMQAPMVVGPLCIFDCPPQVAGAEAVVVTSADRAGPGKGVHVRSVQSSFNFDGHLGDGAVTGLRNIAPRVFEEAGIGGSEADIISVYDDFPVMVLVQLEDLGLIEDGDLDRFVMERLVPRTVRVNTSGGMLTVGQAGPSGGLHGLVECERQLSGSRGEGQIEDARLAVVASYGMTLYRYAAASILTVLEAR